MDPPDSRYLPQRGLLRAPVRDANEEDRALYSKIITPRSSRAIGTTQSSQCPELDDDTFKPEKAFFENLWKTAIEIHVSTFGADTPVTFVPEYGPYPYHSYNAPRTFTAVADSEVKRLQTLFESWAKAATSQSRTGQT